VYGFGGNGAAPLGCIEDGPFVGYINGIGPGRTINDHCIYRFHNNEASWWMSQAFVDYCYQFEDYATAWWCIKGAPHAGGHAAIGGLVSFALYLSHFRVSRLY
jgi:tyrosinase